MKALSRNKKALVIFAALLIVAVGAAAVFLRPGGSKPTGTELVINGDCEQEGEVWLTDAWVKTDGYTTFGWSDEGGGADGGRALTIRNDYLNDARFWQDIAVEPNSLYRISGLIKADCSGGWGANLSVDGLYVYSNQIYDSHGEWVEAVLWGRTGPDQHTFRLYCRLGGYSGEAVGEASFDNISVIKVDALPQGAVAQNIYTEAVSTGEDTEKTGAMSLALSCLAYALLLALGVFWLKQPRQGRRVPGKNWGIAVFAFLALAGLAIRIICALKITGYDVDVNDFRIWADTVARTGPGAFYSADTFCDYPPGYILILYFVGLAGRLSGGTSVFLVKLPSIIADIGTAALIWRYSLGKSHDQRRAVFAAGLYLFNPLTVLVGAAWGQCDSVMTFFVVLAVIGVLKNKWRVALPAYMAAVMVKPQALLFGPLGLMALILAMRTARGRRNEDASRAFRKDVLTGAGLMLAVLAAVVAPFALGGAGLDWLPEKYFGTMASYSYATVNSCNLYFLLGLNWAGNATQMSLVGDAAAALLILAPLLALAILLKNKREQRVTLLAVGAATVLALVLMRLTGLDTCGNVGALIIAMAVIVPGIFCSLSGNAGHLPLCGAACLSLMFSGGAMMHERYLFPAAALLILAYLKEKDKRILILAALLTAAGVLNCGAVLDRNLRIGGSAGHLSAPLFGIESDMAVLEYLSAVMHILGAVMLTALCGEICLCPERVKPLAARQSTETSETAEKWRLRVTDDTLVRRGFFTRKDGAAILILCAAFAALTLTNLGSMKAPQTDYVFTDPEQSVLLDLGEEKEFRLLYYQGIHYAKAQFTVEVAGEDRVFSEPVSSQVTEGDCFKWAYVKNVLGGSTPQSFSGRYIRVTAVSPGVTLFEILARSEDGTVYPLKLVSGAEGAENICDEPFTLEGEPGWYNSAYFDEIYHARTGYEIMKGDKPIYEWTHPPLGKLLIALSVKIFGMAPFFWRLPGALMGVAMLPALYLMALLLTRKRFFAWGAAGLMFLDCMHFTQTRIATIDSYVVCFILWAVFFMVWWFKMDYWGASQRRSLTLLGLSGLFMGLAIAAKWTGCYCGVGLAVIYFWGMLRRLKEADMAKEALGQESEKDTEPDAVAAKVGRHGVRRILTEIGCCFLFFILVPLVIYYVSYIPVLHYEGDISVTRIVEECRRMLNYHSQPGLGMDHPFYSPWYEWPVIAKPMWYDAAQYLPSGLGESITAMGNPAVWYLGSASVLGLLGYVLYALYSGRKTDLTAPLLILVAFAAQFLPWVLVPRGTYIYHYFASVPFGILANVYLWAEIEKKNPRWGRGLMLAQTAAALVLIVAFFPYISGVAVSVEWMEKMQWFPNWLYFSRGTL